MNKKSIMMLLALVLLTWSCSKRQDLVQKAFEDKNFDRIGDGGPNQQVDEPEEIDEDEITETQTEVLVDKINPPQEETIFLSTGETTRPTQDIFSNDPEAPLLNFEEAKLYDIIHVLCQSMKLNYIIDPAVSDQTVTIQMVSSDNKLMTSELFDLILKLHDLTMVVREPFVYIVPISSPEVMPGLELLYGSRPNEALRREELIIQLIPLKYVAPSEMTTVIKDFLSSSARILEEPKNNILIIIDKAQYIGKVMDLIPVFDVDILANKKMVYYQLAHVDAVETATKLQEILAVYGYEPDGERLNLVPIETLNGILVVANSNEIFEELGFWIEKFDREAQYEEDQVFVYYVENTTADTLAGTLSQLFGLRTGGFGGRRGSSAASDRRTTSPTLNANDPNQNQTSSVGQNANTSLNRQNNFNNNNQDGDGPVMIVDEENNALIFQTTPREYFRIRKTLKKIDILPRQVFLEVTVLSVSLTDTYRFGVDWTASRTTQSDNLNADGVLGELVSGGFSNNTFSSTYAYTTLTQAIQATVTAAKAKGYVNVLQQPHIMAIDNKSAQISVGEDTPIITTTSNVQNLASGQGTGITPSSSSTIQYRQTGVSLGFTPHINANGVIRLEINLDISSPGPVNDQGGVPISQNTLQTEMIVRDGQTVVMGGLILDSEDWTNSSVPFLGRIPLLKHLFSNKTKSTAKSELIVMITPKLIDTEEKSIKISKEFKDKILREFETFRDQTN